MTDVPYLSAADQYASASIAQCADALAASLAAADVLLGDPARMVLAVPGGEFIVMPSTSTGHLSAKVLTVNHSAAETEAPRIQGLHVQFDGTTFRPLATLDATALTSLRTAAVSVLALRSLAEPSSRELVVFGAGPQAASHVRGIVAEWPITRVRVVSRRPAPAEELARQLADELPAVVCVATERHLADAAVAESDIVVCATTATEPVFHVAVRDGAAVVAVGSHSPRNRELPGGLMRRAFVVVEERATALREAGDVVLAIEDGDLDEAGLQADLAELVRGTVLPGPGPRVFKSVGMAWEDAVIADAILAARSKGVGQAR